MKSKTDTYLDENVSQLSLYNNSGTVCSLEAYVDIQGKGQERIGKTDSMCLGQKKILNLDELNLDENTWVTVWANVSGGGDSRGYTWVKYRKGQAKRACYTIKGAINFTSVDYNTIESNDNGTSNKVVIYAFSDVHLSGHPDNNDGKQMNSKISESIKGYIMNELHSGKNPRDYSYALISGDAMFNNQDKDDQAYLGRWQNSDKSKPENNDADDFLVCEGFGNHDVITYWNWSKLKYYGRFQNIADKQSKTRNDALKYNGYISKSVTQPVPFGIKPTYTDAYYRWSHLIGGKLFHFINLNLAYGTPKNSDPAQFFDASKDFLNDALKVINKDEPVFIMQHYGFDDENYVHGEWWPKKDQDEFVDKIDGYNVQAIICGHRHEFNKYPRDGKKPRLFRVGSANSGFYSKYNQWSLLRITIEKKDGQVVATYERINGTIDIAPVSSEVLYTDYFDV